MREFVSLGARDAGTDGALRAAEYIADRLRAAGVETRIDAFTDDTPAGRKDFRNVLGRLPGVTQERVILVSHFDTKAGIAPPFEGANDSGSSTGLLIELARLLARAPDRRFETTFAFVDGEECLKRYTDRDGLYGSRRLAEHLTSSGAAEHVRAVIVLDMVGDRDLQVSLPRNSSPELISLVFAAARAEGARQSFRLFTNAVIDDHVPFLLAGMPAVDIIDFHYGSGPGKNDYWHTPEDTIDKLSTDSLQLVGRVVIRMLNELTGTTIAPGP